MVGLAECAPCKAMRLQEEAEEEFKKRFGFVKLNGLAWRPHMGQLSQIFSALTPAKTYSDRVTERAALFSGTTLIGFPLGLLFTAIFPRLRISRKDALTAVLLASGIGAAATFLPFQDSRIVDGVAKFSGLFAGGYLADMALPKKSQTTRTA